MNKVLDIFAYYFSKYDTAAFQALGFDTQTSGFDSVASLFGKKPSYLRRLRDEYDVVTNSSRKGQRNRAPRTRIEEMARYLSGFSFDDLSAIVKTLIDNTNGCSAENTTSVSTVTPSEMTEEELENILNAKDPSATVTVRASEHKTRVYKTAIISQLKRLYKGQCQLCGTAPFQHLDVDICEAHHIDYFASSHNNDASNIVILCPNHHRLIHKLNPKFNSDQRCFEYPDGTREEIKLDYIQ